MATGRDQLLDFRKFLLDKFGSAQDVHALLAVYCGDAPKLTAIEKWFQRGSVPGAQLAALLIILEHRSNVPISLLPYAAEGLNERTSQI